MLAIVDYGRGNLYSISRALQHVGVPHEITGDAAHIKTADRIILPGVGAFGDAMLELRRRDLAEPVIEVADSGRPVLGICVGCQMLFERGMEFGSHDGLGLLRGSVEALPVGNDTSTEWRVPNVGWRRIEAVSGNSLFSGIGGDAMVYFVHSFVPMPIDPVVAARSSFSGIDIAAAVAHRNLVGMQFHPERSGEVGLELIRRFAAMDGVEGRR